MVRVKICGITRLEDARLAAEAGADALGFVFADSPRRTSVEVARAIVASLPPFVTPVGVFTTASVAEIREIARACRLRAVQVHRALVRTEVAALEPLYVVQGFRIGARADAEAAARAAADAVVLDARVEGKAGGTGRTFDWSLLAGIAFERPVILAGGLTAANVESAIRAVRPAAVDVATGVESAPGVKSAPAIVEFVRRAKAAS